MSARPSLSRVTKTANASSQKRKRSTLDLASRITSPRSHKQGSRIEKGREQVVKRGGGHIPLLRTEIQALKDENRALKDENGVLKNESKGFKTAFRTLKAKRAKKYDCSLCRRSYNRSDRYYQHLREGDSEHQDPRHGIRGPST